MLRPILRSKARWIMPYLAAPPRPSPRMKRTNFAQVEETQLRSLPSVKRNEVLRFEAPSDTEDFFDEMKQRFLNFKKRVYLEELEHFRRLAEEQAPKFMVIACADSRVCPSNILGFQPGEAFMIRNVANFVPPLENGPSETNAALEFAVNTLKVENILVIGHSRCGGIETLMSMEDDVNSRSPVYRQLLPPKYRLINHDFNLFFFGSLVHKWISKAKAAKFRTKVGAMHRSFDLQCRHCEKESVNISLLNLLTYPWIEDKVRKDQLSIHGGYYDFLNCTFDKWTLDIKGADINGGRYLVKDQAFWS